VESAGHLLVIGGGREIPGLARAARPGLRTTTFCRIEVMPRVRDVELNERFFVFRDDAPVEEWCEAAAVVHARDPFDFVATYSEKDQDKAAAIAAALGLPGHAPETVRWVHDKAAMRERLAACGVDDTPAFRVRTVQQAHAALREVGLPAILKPARGVSSRGVSRLDGPDDIDAAFAAVEQVADTLDSSEAIIEPLHTGSEFTVDCFSEDGDHLVAGITEKHTWSDHFIEVGHVLPAPLSPDDEKRVEQTVTRMLDALGVRDGFSCVEAMLTGDRTVRIIETHLRPSGDELPYMLADARGVDLIDALARQSVGLPVLAGLREADEAGRRRQRHSAIWYVLPAAPGRLLAVGGLDAARACTGVVEVEQLRDVGDHLDTATGSGYRVAHVRTIADTAGEALDQARTAARLITTSVATTVETNEGEPAWTS
jgi:biotin carboxylase